jgi:glutaredoxin
MDAGATSARPNRAWFGSLALFFGVAVLLLCGIETMAERGLPGMPRAWHSNQILWWCLGFVAVGTGCRFLAPEADHGTAWRPSQSGIRFRQVQLYTRAGCHLCDDAAALLEQHRRWLPRVVQIDVDTEPRLTELYGNCVPVIVCDGKVRFRGRVSAVLLRRLIEGTTPV